MSHTANISFINGGVPYHVHPREGSEAPVMQVLGEQDDLPVSLDWRVDSICFQLMKSKSDIMVSLPLSARPDEHFGTVTLRTDTEEEYPVTIRKPMNFADIKDHLREVGRMHPVCAIHPKTPFEPGHRWYAPLTADQIRGLKEFQTEALFALAIEERGTTTIATRVLRIPAPTSFEDVGNFVMATAPARYRQCTSLIAQGNKEVMVSYFKPNITGNTLDLKQLIYSTEMDYKKLFLVMGEVDFGQTRLPRNIDEDPSAYLSRVIRQDPKRVAFSCRNRILAARTDWDLLWSYERVHVWTRSAPFASGLCLPQSLILHGFSRTDPGGRWHDNAGWGTEALTAAASTEVAPFPVSTVTSWTAAPGAEEPTAIAASARYHGSQPFRPNECLNSDAAC